MAVAEVTLVTLPVSNQLRASSTLHTTSSVTPATTITREERERELVLVHSTADYVTITHVLVCYCCCEYRVILRLEDLSDLPSQYSRACIMFYVTGAFYITLCDFFCQATL